MAYPIFRDLCLHCFLGSPLDSPLDFGILHPSLTPRQWAVDTAKEIFRFIHEKSRLREELEKHNKVAAGNILVYEKMRELKICSTGSKRRRQIKQWGLGMLGASFEDTFMENLNMLALLKGRTCKP